MNEIQELKKYEHDILSEQEMSMKCGLSKATISNTF